MNSKLDVIQNIIRDILENTDIVISSKTRLDEIPELESVAMMTMIALLESEFGIEFDFDDILKFETIGDIEEKL